MAETTYLSVTDTAKMVRDALKREFPGVKFSVRSRSYSGGASIDARWTDGPNSTAVQAVLDRYRGADFDGMQDLKTYRTSELDGRPVHFGADFLFAQREVSDFETRQAEADAYIRAHCAIHGDGPHARFGNQWVSDLASGMVRALDFTKNEDLAVTFRRVVLRETAPRPEPAPVEVEAPAEPVPAWNGVDEHGPLGR